MDRCEAWPTSSTSSPWRWRTLFYATLVVSAVAGCGASAASNGPNTAPVASGAASTTPSRQPRPMDRPHHLPARPPGYRARPRRLRQSSSPTRRPEPPAMASMQHPPSNLSRRSASPRMLPTTRCTARCSRPANSIPSVTPSFWEGSLDCEQRRVQDDGGNLRTQFLTPDGLASFGSLPSDLISRLGEGACWRRHRFWSYAVGYGTLHAQRTRLLAIREPQLRCGGVDRGREGRHELGPVEVALILPGYLSPAHPSGNPAYSEMLSHLELCLTNGGGADTGERRR